MHLVAVCGLKRSGKDVVAGYLSERYGYKHVKVAEKLKRMTQIAFGFTDREIETDAKDRIHPVWGVSPRTCMDYMGTHVFQRDIKRILPHFADRCFWIDDVLRNHPSRLVPNVVLSDLRFHHELAALRRFQRLHNNRVNVTVVRVCRDGTSADGFESESETQALAVDHTLENNDTLESLFGQVDRIIVSHEHSTGLSALPRTWHNDHV